MLNDDDSTLKVMTGEIYTDRLNRARAFPILQVIVTFPLDVLY